VLPLPDAALIVSVLVPATKALAGMLYVNVALLPR